jgi:hypothetical protein
MIHGVDGSNITTQIMRAELEIRYAAEGGC